MYTSPTPTTTPLPRISVYRLNDVRYRFIEFSGVRDDSIVFRAALCLHALAILGGRLVDMLGDRRRSDERDTGDTVVCQQRVHRVFAAVDEGDDTAGELDRIDRLEDDLRGSRDLLAGLVNKRVACRNGIGKKPSRNHCWEIERGDGRECPEWLTDGLFVRGRCDVFDNSTPLAKRIRDLGRDLNVLSPATDLPVCLPQGLSVLL